MIRILRFLWTGSWHTHEWDIIKEITVEIEGGDRWTRFICQCKDCGTITAFNPRGG